MIEKIVKASGPLSAKLWIVGGIPDEKEHIAGVVGAGYSGHFVASKLLLYGESISNVRQELLINKRPKGGKILFFEGSPEQRKELQNSVDSLKERIKDSKPNVVLCLGASSLKYIMGKSSGINDWRGHILWSNELNCKVICTYHPTVCMKQTHVAKDQHPGQYSTLFSADIKKAVYESGFTGLNFEKYNTTIKPTFMDCKNFLLDILDNAKILSYDIETVAGSVMDCIGLAYKHDFAMCIPFYIPTKDGLIPYWKSIEEHKELLFLLKKVMESDIPKVAQNSQYDTIILAEYYKIYVRNIIWDTMVAAHDLYSELPKDLGTLISLYTNIPYQKYLGKSKEIHDRWEYNAADAIANLHVMEGEVKEAKDLGVYLHYHKIPHSALMPCIDMQLAGVKVNEELRGQVIHKESYFQSELDSVFEAIFPKRISTSKTFKGKFNPNSGGDKEFLFLKAFGCKPIYNKGHLSFDKNAMQIYMQDKKPCVRLLAEAIRKYRLSVTMLGKLKTPLKEGRMHCAYDVTGTDTGRLNSKASLFQTGTNLQNLQEGVQRQMLEPDSGEGFCYLDQWAAEAFLTALDAGEIIMLQMLLRGEKIHNWMYNETARQFPEEVKLSNYGYKQAKQNVHSLNYGVETKKMSIESHLPIYVSEWQSSHYHGTFPGIKLRQQRIKNQLYENRTITSLFGRQKVIIAPITQEVINQAYAWPSQSAIGELTLIGMTKLYLYGKYVGKPWMFPALNTHDGLVIRYKLGEEELVKDKVKSAFNIPITKGDVTIRIPIEIGWAKNFNDITNKEIIKYESN